MFWILQVSAQEEEKRQNELFTNQARKRREMRARVRLAERQIKDLHKKEISPKPPSFTVGLAKKGEAVAQAIGLALSSVPYIGWLIAIPARLGYYMLKVTRVTLDFTTRRALRKEEETGISEIRAIKKALDIKGKTENPHGGGFLERLRNMLEEPMTLPGDLTLSPQLSFFVRIAIIVNIIVIITLSAAATIVLMQTLGLL